MTSDPATAEHQRLAKEYFRLLDEQNPDILKLFTEDFTFYFPKFGVGQGAAKMFELMQGLGAVVKSTRHDTTDYLFMASGDHLVVEGTTQGVTQSGATWSAGETPTGRFCNVFAFRNGRIARVSIYLDPDYEGAHDAGFLWGRDGRTW
jgi:ketosteroid isomerase-like protein